MDWQNVLGHKQRCTQWSCSGVEEMLFQGFSGCEEPHSQVHQCNCDTQATKFASKRIVVGVLLKLLDWLHLAALMKNKNK